MNAEPSDVTDTQVIADNTRRRLVRLRDSDALLMDRVALTALLDERDAIISAATPFADSRESGADLPDLVAAMWDYIGRLTDLNNRRTPAVSLPFRLDSQTVVRVHGSDLVAINGRHYTADETDVIIGALSEAVHQVREAQS